MPCYQLTIVASASLFATFSVKQIFTRKISSNFFCLKMVSITVTGLYLHKKIFLKKRIAFDSLPIKRLSYQCISAVLASQIHSTQHRSIAML